MKKLILCVGLLLTTVLAVSAFASPKSNPHFFSAARAEMDLSAMLFKMQLEAGQFTAASDTGTKAKASLDKLLTQAQHETRGHASLFKAFKGFYLAAESYFGDIDPTSPAILVKAEMAKRESALQQAGNAMMLEAKLAGYADK